MLEFTFWKISPEGRTFIFMGVPFIAVAVVAVVIMAVAGVAVVRAARVMAPGKGFRKNPEKFSL